MKYLKEEELCATDEKYTFSSVAEYCYNWSATQGWFQLSPTDKMPGGKKIGNVDGSKSIKPKKVSSLNSEIKLKDYDHSK